MAKQKVARTHYWDGSAGRVVFNGREPYQVDITPGDSEGGAVKLYHNLRTGPILLGTLSYVGDAVVYSGRVASAVFGGFLNLARNALYRGRKNASEPEGLDAALGRLGEYVEPLRRGENSFEK